MTDFQPGNTYSGFVLNRMEHIAEIDSTVLLFVHQLLGTPALAIKNSDANKTFCIAFQTLPEDSTGVPHILEHSALMGSRKYPVKDVFGEIHKGGLMTFLNAMTGADTTFYPFATRNLQEYYNIMDIYCDVTFNPLLLPTTFEQEGWHYHKEDRDQPLQYQGVVYNEMKGAFSDPIRSIFHHLFSGLMPGSTYAHESGGDPRHIPDLTFEQFVDFHRRFYHPSNATLFFYGDADLHDELAFVYDRFLRHFSEPSVKKQIEHGRLIDRPVHVDDTYGVHQGSELGGKTFLAVGSGVGSATDRQQNMAFQIIAQILYNSDASPLKKAIFEAGICKDFGGLFLSSSCLTSIMMTYLIGSDPDRRDAFNSLYRETLGELAAAGLDAQLVLSELNKHEFSVREEMTKAQRGLDLISKCMPALRYGSDPFDALRFDKLFADIRTLALEQRYFEHLIQEKLLDNPSTVEIILRPDPRKLTQTAAEERKRLADFESSLDESEREQLIVRTRELIALQNTPNDPEVLQLLPRLNTDDLPPNPRFPQAQSDQLDGRLLIVNELPTNSISYIDFGLYCSALDADLLPWLSLFGTIVTEIGTADKDYMQFARELGLYTGGFTSSFNTYQHIGRADDCQPVLWLHLKTLSSYVPQALELVGEVFARVSFADRQRIRDIVQREFAWAEHSVQSEGYSLAASRVFSHLSPSGRFNEYVNGITAYQKLKDLAFNYSEQEETFIDALEKIRSRLFNRQALMVSVTGTEGEISLFKSHASSVVQAMDDFPIEPQVPEFASFDRAQGLCTAADVVFNVQGCTLFPRPEEYNGHFEVLKTWISRDYLWNTVRQMGGAYGCFVQFNQVTGNFGLISYRDPNVRKTFEAYDNLQSHVQSLNVTGQSLQQLIIGTYGTLDPHRSPAHQGATARNEFLSGITADYKQQIIRDALQTSPADLRDFAPFFERFTNGSFRATIGSADKIKAAEDFFTSVVDI